MDRGTWQGYKSMGSQRVRHNWLADTYTGLKMIWKIKEIPGKTQGEKEYDREDKEYKRYSK